MRSATILQKDERPCAKDVERCFGVLQAIFVIIRSPCRHLSMDVISNIMFTCCILYNMIIDDKEGVEGLDDIIGELHEGNIPMQRGLSFDEFMASTMDIANTVTHFGLRGDLIEHLWMLKGTNLINI
jgi:hypothetical protein